MESNEGETMYNIVTLCISSLFPILFIVPLYVVSKGQLRDNIHVIRKRMLATSMCVPLMSLIPTFIESKRQCPEDTSLVALMGFKDVFLYKDIVQGAVPVLILFVGSIMTIVLERRYRFVLRDSPETWIRDLCVAPVMEELCFRSGLVSYLYVRGWTPTHLILLSPLFFAISHIHHIYDNIYNRRMRFIHALIVAGIQCAYTYLFGCLAALLLLASGSFVAPCVAHMICNFFGFPRFSEIRYYKNKKVIIMGHTFGVVGFIVSLYYVSSHPMKYLLQATC